MKNDIVLDVTGAERINNLNEWCNANLADGEYESVVMSLFPLQWRYRFSCPKNKLLAVLIT